MIIVTLREFTESRRRYKTQTTKYAICTMCNSVIGRRSHGGNKLDALDGGRVGGSHSLMIWPRAERAKGGRRKKYNMRSRIDVLGRRVQSFSLVVRYLRNNSPRHKFVRFNYLALLAFPYLVFIWFFNGMWYTKPKK